jgi:hypothetical protein
MEFPADFVDMVRLLYRDARLRINVNGFLGASFSPRNGLKQGDGLSCPLYLCAFQPFLSLIATHADTYDGITIPSGLHCHTPPLTQNSPPPPPSWPDLSGDAQQTLSHTLAAARNLLRDPSLTAEALSRMCLSGGAHCPDWPSILASMASPNEDVREVPLSVLRRNLSALHPIRSAIYATSDNTIALHSNGNGSFYVFDVTSTECTAGTHRLLSYDAFASSYTSGKLFCLTDADSRQHRPPPPYHSHSCPKCALPVHNGATAHL